MRAFERMLEHHPSKDWNNAEEVFHWWLYGEGRDREKDTLFEESPDGQ